MNLDDINSLFQLGAAVALLPNIRSVVQDKCIRGVSWAMISFFTAWDFWCVFYYTLIGQPSSALGATAVVLVNAVWVGLALYYTLVEKS